MTNQKRLGLWFAGTSAIFFTRALLFSTFVSRGPEVKAALNLNTAEMGLLSMVFPAGGITGILFAGLLVNRFGTRKVNAATYIIAGLSFVALGPAVVSGNLFLASAALFFVGLPMAISDFVGNIEGTAVDKASKRSLFPAIHGLFGVGMLTGATLASWLIASNVGLDVSFIAVGIFAGAVSVVAGLTFDTRPKKQITSSGNQSDKKHALRVWTEKRSLLIAVIGFSFILAEGAAGVWVPIALTQTGFSGSEAAFAFGVFWIVITIGRLIGGSIVDLIGRRMVVLLSALITSSGILVFMAVDFIALPYMGLVLWGLGMAIGFPMAIASMSDEPTMAPARINMIISVVYISGITVGPALGAVGQVAGLYVAFGIPLVMMLLSAALSGVTRPLAKN
ncbi:MFS transporter [Rhodoluna sp. KAS3]|uniref:MFS transporter n=1 Tax=Rhodoluna sp. KAS3 TaxID=942880 RepID=UPI00222E207D|nr:MFS transporter [Rhodoluna sp. KAS3]BDS49488.1 MFS transporter [Rhodoluna sp. KAS3]